jgi:deazaflavin-dependent oxidoreductase (nitroreductase family)
LNTAMDVAARLQVASSGRKMTAPAWANGPVSWVLRSRFHGLLSSRLMLITVRGRRTGGFHTLPVGYVEVPGTIYVLVGDSETKKWWRNLEGEAPVALIVRGHVRDARAAVLHAESEPQEFKRALGLYLTRFPGLRRAAGAQPRPLMVRCALA